MMMTTDQPQIDLIDHLPSVRGKYLPHFSLADICWLRVGGVADVVFMPTDEDDLARFLRAVSDDISLYVIGAGSNILVRDGGYRGVIIRLGRGFSDITNEGSGCMVAGAAVLDVRFARVACKLELSGAEFFSGIPGTLGGAVAMNAGCYGRETCEVLTRVIGYDLRGERHVFERDELGFRYRGNARAEGMIFTEAHFMLRKSERVQIQATMAKISAARRTSQPIRARTGGSTFKNPQEQNLFDHGVLCPKAWQLIDAAGCRGLQYRDAEVSSTHCNFLINRGNACASDLETLAEMVRARVESNSGYALEWEVRRIGEAL